MAFIVLVLVLVFLIFVGIPFLIALGELLLLVLTVAGVVGRVLFRRPWTVDAVNDAGEHHTWELVGWRRSGEAQRYIAMHPAPPASRRPRVGRRGDAGRLTAAALTSRCGGRPRRGVGGGGPPTGPAAVAAGSGWPRATTATPRQPSGTPSAPAPRPRARTGRRGRRRDPRPAPPGASPRSRCRRRPTRTAGARHRGRSPAWRPVPCRPRRSARPTPPAARRPPRAPAPPAAPARRTPRAERPAGRATSQYRSGSSRTTKARPSAVLPAAGARRPASSTRSSAAGSTTGGQERPTIRPWCTGRGSRSGLGSAAVLGEVLGHRPAEGDERVAPLAVDVVEERRPPRRRCVSGLRRLVVEAGAGSAPSPLATNVRSS